MGKECKLDFTRARVGPKARKRARTSRVGAAALNFFEAGALVRFLTFEGIFYLEDGIYTFASNKGMVNLISKNQGNLRKLGMSRAFLIQADH
ncbi:hypothetical protein Acr_27g0000160 [Actinidia rufa]|uniref:Uncharacterized protein n=1 Tax=Actinidia rufa TaxID=165716 RepID=A0A7J0H597_9ERIC|nr:hypothetical protein Acr_27g0000160 [Actinidia rufa]